ncbi:MAG: rhomboid family intramembrane serine protease [Parachlamydiaceae bacterium]|nr:rhomboid family intramembrane serine protease [Parachlamydiaceae bacterium]
MRLIGTISDERKGLAFSLFLKHKGIHHELELNTNQDWGSNDYGISKCLIWITDEDQVAEAMKWFRLFEENPQDPIFEVMKPKSTIFQPEDDPDIITIASTPKPAFKNNSNQEKQIPPISMQNKPLGPITRFIILGCCLLFLLSHLLTPKVDPHANASASVSTLFNSPVEKVMLFDYPSVYGLIEKLVNLYGYEALQDVNTLPPDGQQLVEKINHTPYWQGLYNIILKDGFGAIKEQIVNVPMFEKIRQGEIWRLITPDFLHADIFHLFFNMLWLLVLGKQIEQRMTSWSYIFFIVIVGIFSNIAQYIMSGANFIGFSGILCGMLTYIWMRQRYAPWEGYQLDKMTIISMLVFIGAMAVIQMFSFVLEKSTNITISPGIANMAHLSGAFIGLILGRFNFFSWRST